MELYCQHVSNSQQAKYVLTRISFTDFYLACAFGVFMFISNMLAVQGDSCDLPKHVKHIRIFAPVPCKKPQSSVFFYFLFMFMLRSLVCFLLIIFMGQQRLAFRCRVCGIGLFPALTLDCPLTGKHSVSILYFKKLNIVKT